MISKIIFATYVIVVSFDVFVQNHPLVNSKTPSVVVNTTNFNDPKVDTVITNTADLFVPPPLPQGTFSKNDVKFGYCAERRKQIVHNENILIESVGPSTLSGIFEFYIDAPVTITCIEVLDKLPPGTGAEVSLKSGGPGYNWFFLNVQGKYARGIHIVVIAYGIPDYRKIELRKQ